MKFEQIKATNIFVGDQKAAADAKVLKAYDIKIVLNVCNDINSAYIDPEITYLKWGLDDPQVGDAERNDVYSAALLLSMASNEAASRGGNILVHCASGNNRCRFVVAAHLYRIGMFGDLAEACEFTKVKDHKDWMRKRGWE